MYMLTIIKKLRVRYNNMYADPTAKLPQVDSTPNSSSLGSQSLGPGQLMASKASDQPADVQI